MRCGNWRFEVGQAAGCLVRPAIDTEPSRWAGQCWAMGRDTKTDTSTQRSLRERGKRI